jgi:hypothetical protein
MGDGHGGGIGASGGGDIPCARHGAERGAAIVIISGDDASGIRMRQGSACEGVVFAERENSDSPPCQNITF